MKGVFRKDSLWSSALGEQRELSIYVPPVESVGILYAADGQFLEHLVVGFDEAISVGQVAPLVLVGSDAPNDERRAGDYLADVEPSRFRHHLRFFVEELPAWADLHVRVQPSPRLIWGFSNGATFAMSVSLLMPDVFDAVIAFAVTYSHRVGVLPTHLGLSADPGSWWIDARPPAYVLRVGSRDSGAFITRGWADVWLRWPRWASRKLRLGTMLGSCRASSWVR